jgi:transposase
VTDGRERILTIVDRHILTIDLKAVSNPSPLQELEFLKRRTALLKRINRFRKLQCTYMPELVRFMTTPQREIWNDKTRGAESVKLFLPSELSTASREKTCETGLDKIEEEMREAELKVALEDLRQALRARTATNRFRHRNTMGQKALMRGQGVLRQIDIRIMKAKLCYRYARNTLLRLRGHGVWEKVWNVLEDADVRGINERAATDEEEADRERLRRLGQIVEGGISRADLSGGEEDLIDGA